MFNVVIETTGGAYAYRASCVDVQALFECVPGLVRLYVVEF